MKGKFYCRGDAVYNGGSVQQTYILEPSNMEAVAAGDKADGATSVAGTSDYFTIVWSANMAIDSSNKTFSDTYSASKRIKLAGKWGDTKQYIKFTTTKASTVKVWWVPGNTERALQIAKKSDKSTIIAQDNNESSTDPRIATLTLTDAAEYMLGSSINGNYIFKVEVTE